MSVMDWIAPSRRAGSREPGSNLRAIGDEEFAALFERFHDAVRAYLRRRIEPAVADDLAAQTFLEAFGARGRYDPERGPPRAWLYGIAANLLRHHRRAEERRLRAYARAALAEPRAEHGDAGDLLDLRVAAPALTSAIVALPPGEREVLLHFALVGRSYQEIAAAVGIPVGTVRSRLNRARARVRRAVITQAACRR
jgi:RNA polymerase sigma factor (sigma-70 family)